MKNFAGAVALIFLAAAATPQTARAQATDPSRWMGELADQYAGVPSPMDQTLAQFIFPGTHNSATYGIPDFDLARAAALGLAFIDAPPVACDACVNAETKSIIETPGLDVLMGYFEEPECAYIVGPEIASPP